MENENKIIERVVKLETKSEQHDKDIDELKDTTKAINRLATSVELIAQQWTTTNEKIDNLDENLNKKIDSVESKVVKVGEQFTKLDKDLSEVKNKDLIELKNKDDKADAKKWRNLVKQVLTILVSIIMGIVLAKIGLQ